MPRVPPRTHLRKAQARLRRANEILPDARDLGQPRRSLPDLDTRKQYALELELVLRDYERILEDLLSDE